MLQIQTISKPFREDKDTCKQYMRLTLIQDAKVERVI